MSFAFHDPQTDLALPDLRDAETWDPLAVFTHCSLLSVPEASLSVFVYLRCQPYFKISQGGVSIFSGLDNPDPFGVDYLDYRNTMPWPTIQGTTITTANGLCLDFVEPGKTLRITYGGGDDETSIDVTQTAVGPLLARGHIIPGEQDRFDASKQPGGSEQFMHTVGQISVRGTRHEVDSYDCRDRSWAQVRSEDRGAVRVPPVAWTPMYFGEDLIFNQVSIEPEDTDPWWAGVYEVPADAPTHHYAWIQVAGTLRKLDRVRRDVRRYHPTLFAAVEQTIEATDETGATYRFDGEAVAMAAVPVWTNAALRQFLYRWTNAADGRSTYASGQEIWMDQGYQWRAAERAAATRTVSV
jgi:hypothetical protein